MTGAAKPRDMDFLKDCGGIAALDKVLWVQKLPVPLEVHFAVEADLVRTDAPYNGGHILTKESPRGDRGVAFKPGDAILTGTQGECWPIPRRSFDANYLPFGRAHGGEDGKFYKRPSPILGVQMKEPFTVTASWGKLEGKSGDWLVQYDEAGQDMGIVSEAIFAETYRRVRSDSILARRLLSARARAREMCPDLAKK